jgi:X-X-X-Leu-X-X-Gly heptad repeat protein
VSKPIHPSRRWPNLVIASAVALILALAALLARVGADAQWLAALGHVIAVHHTIPAGVPFAAAPTSHWPNVLVLAELIFNGLERTLGDRGLMLAQLLAVAVAAGVLARDARAGGAEPGGASAALLLAALGVLPSLAIARVQLFSIALFPVLIALLRAQARAPSRRIWLVVPLIALWSNLHGAALVGELVVLAYLGLARWRRDRVEAALVGAASCVALCLTPALARTIAYYHGVLTNLAAQRGEGMWGPLSLSAPLDVVLIVAALLLAIRLWRARPELWEWCVIAGLALLTVQASRNGVWLMFFLVGPAARAFRPKRTWEALTAIAAVASVVAVSFAVLRGPQPEGASRTLVAGAVKLAQGSPVLADGTTDEQVALAGGRIWIGNPIDAFTRADQAAYLDWLQGARSGRSALVPGVRVVLVSRGSKTQTLMAQTAGFAVVGGDRTTALYERVR